MAEIVTFDPSKWEKDGCGTESSIRSNSAKYNEGTMIKQLIHEELNSAMNWHTIVERIKNGTARDISFEPKMNKAPALIIGSGPSLDYSIQFMKNWKHGIFCTSSHALTLMKHGIEPSHIVALDPFCTWEEIQGVDWSKTRTKLITHPGVWPTLIENWPNEMLLYIENLGRQDSYYATVQKRMYTHREFKDDDLRNPVFHYYIPTEIVLFACSPPMQLFMANILDYGNLFLCGVDFAFHQDKERFTNYTVDMEKTNDSSNFNELGEKKIIWDEHVHPFIPTERTIKTNNGLPTEEIHLYYKKNMLSAWRLSLKTLYTTDKGSITEVPYMSMEQVMKKEGSAHTQTVQFIADASERYLASVGAFVVQAKNGVSFVEAVKPENDLTQYMMGIFQQYKCKCGATMKANDEKSYAGTLCEKCKINRLEHVHEIDIVANIKRFIHLMKFNDIETSEEAWHMDFFKNLQREDLIAQNNAKATIIQGENL